MRTLTPCAAAALILGLAACEAPPSDEPVAAPAAPTRTEAPPEAPPPAPIAGVLPLEPGVYVAQGTDCGAPANAGFRIYDGRGVSGSATRECRLSVASVSGSTHVGRQSCLNTYDQTRTETRVRIEVPSRTGFTIEDGGTAQTFRRCDPAQLPDYLREMAPG